MKRRMMLWVCVAALACSPLLARLTGARTGGACGAGACFAPGTAVAITAR